MTTANNSQLEESFPGPCLTTSSTDGDDHSGRTQAPFVFIATNTVADGMLADEQRRAPKWAEFIRGHEPRVIAFHEYVSADGTEVEFVQIHPDAASFEYHLDILESAQDSFQTTLEATTAMRIYGTPTERILTTLRRSTGPEVPIRVMPTHLGGFATN